MTKHKAIQLLLLPLILTLNACSTVDKKHVAKDGVQYTNAKHGIKVWRAENIDLAKYKTLVVPRPTSKVPEEKQQKEREQFQRLLTELHSNLSAQLLSRSLVSGATLSNSNAPVATAGNPAASNALILETEIVEYYRGNPALRFTVGFGAGTPTILVKGLLRDGATSQPILRFAARRGIEFRAFEYDDETILTGNIRDLATDCAETIINTLKPAATAKKP